MHWVAIAERYKVSHLYVEMLCYNGRQNIRLWSVFQKQDGNLLDELYEGYSFKRKEGRLFIFETEEYEYEHELAFTMSTVQDTFYQRAQEESITDLQTKLDELVITNFLSIYLA